MAEVIRDFRDLKVYQLLVDLHLELHAISMKFPRFELFELGSQMRRSSNSCPANVAEGFNNKHTNIYRECINRAIAEANETRHHLMMALAKKYLTPEKAQELLSRYELACRMLRSLERAIANNPRS